MLRSSRNSSRSQDYDDYRVISFLEFQSTMLKILGSVRDRHLSVKNAFKKLISFRGFFAADDSGAHLNFKWPYRDEYREIQVTFSEDANGPMLEFSHAESTFLTVTMNGDKGLQAFIHAAAAKEQEWEVEDIQEIVEAFNQILQANEITYKSRSKKQFVTHVERDDVTRFSKAQFNQFIDEFENFNLTFRIDNIIVPHAKRRSEQYTFYLDWPDSLKQSHLLKVTFSRGDTFTEQYSWVATEETLLKEFPSLDGEEVKPGQRYYSLSVKEIVDPNLGQGKKSHTDSDSQSQGDIDDLFVRSQKEVEILSIWLAVDGLVGELRDLKKGDKLTGNDVLGIYAYFDRIFEVKNTLICDESRLADEEDKVRIPLRLISALCTGQTWYQAKIPGVKLFECRKFPSAYNGVISQEPRKWNKALNELQNLRLCDWHDMLDEKKQLQLLRIYSGNAQSLPKSTRRSTRLFASTQVKQGRDSFGEATLKDLASSLFNDSKAKRTITNDLVEFIDLLCGNMHWGEDYDVPKKLDVDFWLKSRVREILWGGYFWVKEAEVKDEIKAYSPK